MNDHPSIESFRSNTVQAVHNTLLRGALRNATGTFGAKRIDAMAGIPLEDLRERASNLRLHVLDHLHEYVDRFAKNATKAGAVVHRARDAAQAREIVADLLKDRSMDKVVKAKSMVTEEIHLNDHLIEEGIRVLETDLGEYIIQLAGEHPSHIIVPAIHKDRRQVGKLFAEKLGCAYVEDPAVLTKIAHETLRPEFLSAEAGISGANFAIADSGSLVIFTNEGNGRMCTTMPWLHVAVLSVEKMVPSLEDLPLFMRLLPRSATGQILTSYMSLITGNRKPGDTTGPKELHIVLLDNGRSSIVQGPYREMLKCIRCGACLNACPIYRMIGGHAYGSTYPGPMGIVLTALLDGIEHANPLLDATTLCGACGDVCPVKVPLPQLLRHLREERVARGLTPSRERMAMAGFGLAAKSPALFSWGQTAASLTIPTARYLTGMETLHRLPDPARETFHRRMA